MFNIYYDCMPQSSNAEKILQFRILPKFDPGAHVLCHDRSFKAIGTKAPFNGGFAFAWLNTKLCARLHRPDLFMNRPASKQVPNSETGKLGQSS